MERANPRPGRAREQAHPAVHRIRRLPLVPRHGPREFRERGHRHGDEQPVHQHQGGPRGAPRPGRHLPVRPGPDGHPGRMAPDHVPHSRARAFLGRHLFSRHARLRPARVSRPVEDHIGNVPQSKRNGAEERRRDPRGLDPPRPAGRRRRPHRRAPGPGGGGGRPPGRPPARRHLGRAEVSPALLFQVPVAGLPADRLDPFPRGGHGDPGHHVPGRHLRSPGRRLFPVFHRRAVAGAPLREDAL